MSFHRWTSTAAFLGAFVLGGVSQAAPQEYRVVSNEYIVKRVKVARLANVQPGTGDLDQSNRLVGDAIGKHLDLVKLTNSNGVTLRSQSMIVPYREEEDRCGELLQDPQIVDCTPNYVLSIDSLPNDRHRDKLWGLSESSFGAQPAKSWSRVTDAEDVVVAVLDTGIDYNHPDLEANLWRNTGEIQGNGVDDDGNGYVDDYYGINAITGNGDPLDDHGHGTHVAGVIGAEGNNSLGVVGVSWRVQIMSLKFLDSRGLGSLASALRALNYLEEMRRRGVNVRVANNSWGGAPYSQMLFEAIERLNGLEVMVIAAAGNVGSNNDTSDRDYPAGFELPNVVSVAAIDEAGELASFSNFGPTSVDLAAPGDRILSTFRGGTYQYLSGTSMAAPFVSGAFALALSVKPDIENRRLKSLLLSSASVLPGLSGKVRSGASLNIGAMIEAVVEQQEDLESSNPAAPSPSEQVNDNLGRQSLLRSLDLTVSGRMAGARLKQRGSKRGVRSKRAAKRNRAEREGLTVSLAYESEDTGGVEFEVSLNGVRCVNPIPVELSNLEGELLLDASGGWSRKRKLSKIKVFNAASGLSDQVRLSSRSRVRRRSRSYSSFSAKRAARICRGVSIVSK